MRRLKFAHSIVLIATALLLMPMVSAQQDTKIGELSELDKQFMAQQRKLIEDMAAVNLGRRINGNTQYDLQTLQLLLDRRLVKAQQTRELQAMGVIMGDLLAADLNMHWIIYEDSQGRSRALRYKTTDEILFPITMISRRREVGNDTPVATIYQKAYDIIDPLRADLPFR